MSALESTLVELARVKKQIEDLTKYKGEVEEIIILSMEKADLKTVTVDDLRGTLVKGSIMTIDEDALKKRLTAAQWKKVTKQVLDKEALEAHIVTKDIDANVVAAVSTEKDRKPYIKVTGSVPVVPPANVTTKNSAGHTKPAAKKRVVKPKKK